MAIRLYVAPAAAGKTAYAVTRAREAACALAGSVQVCVANQLQRRSWHQRLAEAGGALGVRVVSFASLYRDCLSAVGAALTELDDPVQHRLLRALVQGAELAHYAPLRDKPGFPVLLHDLIAELKAAGVGPAEFAGGVAAFGDEPRLRELAWLYGAYQQTLAQHAWADQEELGWATLRALEDNPALGSNWSLLVLDGFDSLTTVQLRTVVMLAGRARETLITLTGPLDGVDRQVQRRFADTRRRLEEALGVSAQPLPECCDRQAGLLAHLERSLFTGHAARAPGTVDASGQQAVELLAAADRGGEVRAALRWLKAQCVTVGCALSDLALLARNVAPYRALILQTAHEFGIPIRLLDGQPLARVPVIAALLDLLRLFVPASADPAGPLLERRVLVETWRSPYMRWGDINIQPGDAERLDALARWGCVVAGLEQWREAFTRIEGRDTEMREDVDRSGLALSTEDARELRQRFERFVQRLTPPASACSVRGLVGWIEDLIGDDGSEGQHDSDSLQMVACARAGEASAEWDLAALRALKGVLRGLVWADEAVAPATRCELGSLLADLEAAVETAVCYLPEEGLEDRLLVADVVQARGVPLRAVALVGLAEGEFPATLHEDPLLRDADREGLDRDGHALEPSTQSAEMGYFYEAMCRPRERLLLTRPRLAENGAPWEPSPFWREVLELADLQPRVLTSEKRVPPGEAASWSELFEGLAGLPAESPWHVWARARQPEQYAAWQRAGTVVRARTTRKPFGEHNGDLSALSARLATRFAPNHRWSASALETYLACPHRFFVSRVLGLEAREEPIEGLDPRQLGNIYHRLLEAVYKDCDEQARTQADPLIAALERVAGPILDEAPTREGFRVSAWWYQTRNEIVENIRRTLAALTALDGAYVPTLLEMRFDCEIPAENPLETPLRLHGIIDRLDRAPDGRLRVIDYKTAGPTEFSRNALSEGKKVQLPLYAAGARAVLGGEIGEGFYWHVRSAERSGLRLSVYGVDAAIADALRYAREAIAGVQSGAFVPRPPAGGCPDYCPAASYCAQYRPGSRW